MTDRQRSEHSQLLGAGFFIVAWWILLNHLFGVAKDLSLGRCVDSRDNMASLHVAVPPAGSAEPSRTPVAALGSVAANGDAFTVVVLGASGDLAHKKTYPSLFELFVSGLLPRNLIVVGFARSPIADAEFREKIKPSLKGGSPKQVEDFLALCIYRHGGYDDESAFRRVVEEIAPREAAASQTGAVNRLFYFAVPPTVFVPVAKSIHAAALSASGWNRIVIEKPFGKDLASSNALSAELAKYFSEEQIYRIDHYLGKEMVQNLFVLRFANAVFEPLWNRHHISNIQVRAACCCMAAAWLLQQGVGMH